MRILAWVRTRRLAPGLRGVSLLLLATALASGPGAELGSAYGWPVRPFARQHPLIGSFGEPRTIFSQDFAPAALQGPGEFSFHNGIDIAAAAATPVYPVVSGRVHVLSPTALVVRSRGRVFQYYHLQVAVREGHWVRARRSVLGFVLGWAKHVHLSEIDHGRVQNPLAPGHLAPYVDRTAPVVSGVEFRAGSGRELDPAALHGSVDVVAAAYDASARRRRRGGQAPLLAPASLSWSATTPAGRVVLGTRTTVDFRRTLPPNAAFWAVYARGTYENSPTFGTRVLHAPGRYLFHLAPGLLDTSFLPNGPYLLKVTATDIRGNAGTLSSRFVVANEPPLIRRWAAGRVAAR